MPDPDERDDESAPDLDPELELELALYECGRHASTVFRCDFIVSEYCQFRCPFRHLHT